MRRLDKADIATMILADDMPREAVFGPILLDRSVLAELEDVLGPESVEGLLALLARDLHQQAGTIAGLAARGDVIAARRAAHSLRGGAAAVGATCLATAAAAIEDAEPGTATLRAADALCDVARVTLDALETHRRVLPPVQPAPGSGDASGRAGRLSAAQPRTAAAIARPSWACAALV